MRPRVIWIAVLGVVLATGGTVAWYMAQSVGWETHGASTHLNSIGADVFFLNVPELVRRGPPRLVVVRLEQPSDLVPYHYAHENLPAPQTVEDWALFVKAPVVFNAGQFDERMAYLGWLKSKGVWLSETRKSAWMGLLVSGPNDGGAWGRVVDLETADPGIVQRYANVVQSMMLVDDGERVRVRKSELAACRTVVAEDKQGRLLIIATEGAVTLFDLARWLPRSGLDIVRAMNLDGGIESQLAINTPELSLTLYGQYGTDATVFEARGQMVRYPLPAVIAVRPAPGD